MSLTAGTLVLLLSQWTPGENLQYLYHEWLAFFCHHGRKQYIKLGMANTCPLLIWSS